MPNYRLPGGLAQITVNGRTYRADASGLVTATGADAAAIAGAGGLVDGGAGSAPEWSLDATGTADGLIGPDGTKATGNTAIAAAALAGGSSRAVGTGVVEFGVQQAGDINAGSGIYQVLDAANAGGVTQLTRYQYGGTIRQTGAQAHMFEFFVGDTSVGGNVPTISIRHNGSNTGARMEVRNAADTSAIQLDNSQSGTDTTGVSTIGVSDDTATPDKLKFRHPRSTGYMVWELNGTERLRLTPGGLAAFGGATSSFPALKRGVLQTDALEARVADDTNYASVFARTLRSVGTFTDASNADWLEVTKVNGGAGTIQTNKSGTGVAGSLIFGTGGATALTISTSQNAQFSGRVAVAVTLGFGSSNDKARIQSPTNGNLELTNAAETDFGLLQFGGTTSSFPALKRSTTALQAKLADDSAFTAIQGKLTTDSAYSAGSTGSPTGTLTIYDSNGTAYRVDCKV